MTLAVEQKKEILKCASDPIHFLKKWAMIQHPTRGLIPFALFDYQEEYIRRLLKNRFNILLKARQIGITETTAGYIIWLCLFWRDKTVIAVSKDRDAAAEIIRRARILYKHLPKWLQIARLIKDNVHSLEFSNRSRVQSLGRTKDVARSKSASLLVIDEAAAIPWLEEMMTSAQPIISTGGNCVILSTPKGINTFYRYWTDAENDQSNYVPFKLHWTVHPEHDKEWFQRETKGMLPHEIAQEFELDFAGSGHTLVEGEKLLEINKTTVLAPDSKDIIKEWIDRNFWIFKRNEPHKTYILAADPARGDGKDYSAIQILDSQTWEQAAEYKGHILTDDFGKLIVFAARMYNNCGVVVENTGGYGVSVLNEIQRQNYTNLYYTVKGTTSVIPYQDTVLYRDRVLLGFSTNLKTRPQIMNKLEQAIRNDLITLRSSRIIDELRTFKWINGKLQAESGYHDDLVLALAMALWAVDRASIQGQQNQKYCESFLDNMSVINKVYDQVTGTQLITKQQQNEDLVTLKYSVVQNDFSNKKVRKNIKIDLRELMK